MAAVTHAGKPEGVHPNGRRIAIVGAGFSGTMVTVNLLRQSDCPLHIHIFEKKPERIARGVAYATAYECHLLNVPASNMSALPGDPGHFLRWARATDLPLAGTIPHGGVEAGDFLPRRLYGAYLHQLLKDTVDQSAHRHRVQFHHEEAVGIAKEGHGCGVRVRSACGTTVHVDRVVLSVGNFPPGDVLPGGDMLSTSGRYHRDPWHSDVLPQLLSSRSCLLVGSGLTMLDVVAALDHRGYTGTVHVVSRRGLKPLPHVLTSAEPDVSDILAADGLRTMVTAVRHTARANENPTAWRAVIDAMRPYNAQLWSRLSLQDKRRFLRHVRPYWETHRHRCAPLVHHVFASLHACKAVVFHRARVQRADIVGQDGLVISLRHRVGTTTISVDHVVNCAGPDCNYRRLDSALIRDLLDQGLAKADPTGLGLATATSGGLLSADGTASDSLYTLGPPKKGAMWETTAVPELRVQAVKLAQTLLLTS
jgi:uncharacterized NAD(P)/FAD-binding protein YdhS